MTATAEPTSDLTTEPLRSRRNHWNNQIRRHAFMTPDTVAIKYLDRATTWRELDERSHAFAAALHRRGVGFGDRVLMILLNRTEYLEAILGANLIGAIPVPVNFRMSPGEVAYLVRDSGARVVVTEQLLAPLADAATAATGLIETTIVVDADDDAGHLDYETLLAEDGPPIPDIDVPEDTVSLIMYTSGTTGKPKGAMLTHQNLHAQAVTTIASTAGDTDDIASVVPPIFHIAGIGAFTPVFYRGIRSIIHPLGAFDAEKMLDAMEREGTTSVFMVQHSGRRSARRSRRIREISNCAPSPGARHRPRIRC